MPRPRDEDGRLLPPAHKRLDEAPDLEQAIVFRWAEDGRLCFLPLKRRLAVARRAMDHIYDGASEPKAFLKPDKMNPSNTACLDAWRAALDIVRSARSGNDPADGAGR